MTGAIRYTAATSAHWMHKHVIYTCLHMQQTVDAILSACFCDLVSFIATFTFFNAQVIFLGLADGQAKASGVFVR